MLFEERSLRGGFLLLRSHEKDSVFGRYTYSTVSGLFQATLAALPTELVGRPSDSLSGIRAHWLHWQIDQLADLCS